MLVGRLLHHYFTGALDFTEKQRTDRLSRSLLHGRQNVAVDTECRTNVGITEAFLNDFRILTRL